MYGNNRVVEGMLDNRRCVKHILECQNRKQPFYCLLGILRKGEYNWKEKCKYCEYGFGCSCIYGEEEVELSIC